MQKSNNPWDALPRPQTGTPDLDVLYAAVGRALSQWEVLESNLARIFQLLCNASEAAAVAYGAVSSFTGRCDMLEAAFRCYSGKKKFARLPKLLGEIKKFSARRNDIAHGVAIESTRNKVAEGYLLVPSFYNSRKRPHWMEMQIDELDPTEFIRRLEGAYAYNDEQIEHYRSHFARLSSEVSSVHFQMIERRIKLQED